MEAFYPCMFCEAVFVDLGYAKDHMKECHSKDRRMCNICSDISDLSIFFVSNHLHINYSAWQKQPGMTFGKSLVITCKWALNDANEITKWDNRIRVVDQFLIFKNIPRDPSLSTSIQQFMDYTDEKGRAKLVHLRAWYSKKPFLMAVKPEKVKPRICEKLYLTSDFPVSAFKGKLQNKTLKIY